MKKNMFVVFVVVVILLLSGCSSNGIVAAPTTAPTPTPDTQATQIAELANQIATLQVAASATPLPTATAMAPTATATASVQQQAPTSANCDNSQLQVLYLTVVNPQDASQPQIGHPSAYAETHISDTAVCLVMDIPEGFKGIVGGVKVGNQSDGVYQGYASGHIEVVVTNGFGLITSDSWAKAEFDFRVAQATQYNWAHTHVDSGPIK